MKLGVNEEEALAVELPVETKALKALGERTKRELRRHQLSDRDRLLADALCDISFGQGLQSVKIPKLEMLGDLIGLPRQAVYTNLQRLHEMRIVAVRSKEGLWCYAVNPNSEGWKVMPRVALSTILQATAVIREVNGLPSVEENEASESSALNDPRQRLLSLVPDSMTVMAERFPEVS